MNGQYLLYHIKVTFKYAQGEKSNQLCVTFVKKWLMNTKFAWNILLLKTKRLLTKNTTNIYNSLYFLS